MGKPAARLGDMTAHGGSIVVGFPTVLIGGQPAARIGDMHVCPMMNPGPSPHVGGPVSMGSPTVLIGGMPATRVGDMATCAGPPDTIAMGCPTVLIGEAGSGSASGGGASGAAAANASAATALTDNNESITKEEHWIAFEFVDSAGLPVSGIPYTFTDPDSNISEAVLRLDGTVRRDALSEGECTVVLMGVSNAKWSVEEADVGEQVQLTADLEGFDPAPPALFQVFKRDLTGPDVVVAQIEAEVQGEKVEAEWTYEYPEEEIEPVADGPLPCYSAPEYYFEVIIGKCKARSGLLGYKDYIEIELKDEDDNPLGNRQYVVYLSNGEVRQGMLDGNGYTKEEDVPPGLWQVKFPE